MNKRSLTSLTAAFVTAGSISTASANLTLYDQTIAADNTGGLPYAGILSTAQVFDGTSTLAFNFGSISGAGTFEFILEGDPSVSSAAIIAEGSNGGNTLRYEQWDNTGRMGFTRSGVADYDFGTGSSLTASPTTPTHVAFRWDGAGTMDLYVDGALASSISGATFDMPTGAGSLGRTGTEQFVGTIHRVTTYDSALAPGTITAHANAWLNPIPEPSTLTLFGLIGGIAFLGRRRR